MPIHDWSHTHPGIFHHFHHEWISTIARALNSGLLPPEYYALAEQIAGLILRARRARLSGPWYGVTPDERPRFFRRKYCPWKRSRDRQRAKSSIHGLDRVRSVRKEKEPDCRASHLGGRGDRGFEIVSPGNKSSQFAMRSFVDKAIRLLDAGIHLLILDLLPPGPRDPQGIHGAIWSEMSDENDFRLPPDDPRHSSHTPRTK